MHSPSLCYLCQARSPSCLVSGAWPHYRQRKALDDPAIQRLTCHCQTSHRLTIRTIERKENGHLNFLLWMHKAYLPLRSWAHGVQELLGQLLCKDVRGQGRTPEPLPKPLPKPWLLARIHLLEVMTILLREGKHRVLRGRHLRGGRHGRRLLQHEMHIQSSLCIHAKDCLID